MIRLPADCDLHVIWESLWLAQPNEALFQQFINFYLKIDYRHSLDFRTYLACVRLTNLVLDFEGIRRRLYMWSQMSLVFY